MLRRADSRGRRAFRGFAPASYIGALDPNVVWEVLIGGIVVASFLAAIALWMLSALRRAKRAQLRRNAFISSALNTSQPGRDDDRTRKAGSSSATTAISKSTGWRAPIFRRDMTGRELLELRRTRGLLDVTVEEF